MEGLDLSGRPKWEDTGDLDGSMCMGGPYVGGSGEPMCKGIGGKKLEVLCDPP